MSERPELSLDEMDFEARSNLVGFFDLLLKIDRRINPERYENNRDTNNPD